MFPDFLDQDATTVARKLLGCEFVTTIDSAEVRVRIVETESYDQADAASHSYRGRTPRTDVMFRPSGHLYVYFTYGMHYCCNVVTGPKGKGSAVLIRAVEPLEGAEVLEKRRGKHGRDATNGPAKLCQALGIGREHNGHNLRNAPLQLTVGRNYSDSEVVVTTRIGIRRAIDEQRRFYVQSSDYVSVRTNERGL